MPSQIERGSAASPQETNASVINKIDRDITPSITGIGSLTCNGDKDTPLVTYYRLEDGRATILRCYFRYYHGRRIILEMTRRSFVGSALAGYSAQRVAAAPRKWPLGINTYCL